MISLISFPHFHNMNGDFKPRLLSPQSGYWVAYEAAYILLIMADYFPEQSLKRQQMALYCPAKNSVLMLLKISVSFLESFLFMFLMKSLRALAIIFNKLKALWSSS